MATRKSAEEKIADIVNAAIEARDRKSAEEKDPNKAWLRQAIREEVSAVLGELKLGGGSGAPNPREDEGEDRNVFSLFG